MRIMKILTVLLLFPVVIPFGTIHAQVAKHIDKIVAVVGNEIITLSELEIQILRLGMRSKIDSQDPALRRRVLDELINTKLMLAQAVLDSVAVSEEMVTAQVNEQIRNLEQTYGGTSQLEQTAGMTVAQLKREYREDVRKKLMIESLQREKFGTVTVTNREVEEFFQAFRDSLPQIPEQVHLRIIAQYPRVTDDLKEATRKKALALLDSLRDGSDFAELARRHSDDVGSARNGGDLGLARRGVFVKEFEEAAFNLQPGELSDVIETQFGFHIIKLNEKKGEAIRTSHILLRIEKTAESDAIVIERLKHLRERILAGEVFAALAREHSEDPLTKQLGGDMQLVEVAQLSADLRLIQQKLAEGEISQPEKITMDRDYAIAIVKLEKRIPPHAPNLKDDYQRIMNFARIFKQNDLYTEWLQSLRKSVYWNVFL